jgi:hypothetical protein
VAANRGDQKKKRTGLSGALELCFDLALSVIEPGLPPADAHAVGVPPATRTNHGRTIEAITSAITSTAAIEATTATAIETTTAAAKASATASAATCQRGCSCSAHQDGRGAGDIDEQQSQRCQAAGQNIVAFSHSKISGHFQTSGLRHYLTWTREKVFGSDALRQYFQGSFGLWGLYLAG